MKVFVLICKPFANIIGTYLDKELARVSAEYLNFITDSKNYIVIEQKVIID